MSQTISLEVGSLAYLDTMFSGLIPLKVIRIEADVRQDGKPVKHVVAKVTAERGPYKRGEVVTSESPGRILPSKAVKRSRQRIGAYYTLPFEIGEVGP